MTALDLIRDVDVVDGTGAPSVPRRRRWSTRAGSPRSHAAETSSTPDATSRRRIAGSGPRPRLHRHARALRPAACSPTPDHFAEDQPGRHHRSDRPGRPVLRTCRRCRARRGPQADRRLERQPDRLRLLLAHRRRTYLDRLDGEGIAANAAYLVPQGTLRLLAVGCRRPPGDADRDRPHAGSCSPRACEQGAVGMSSGLTYTPACTPTPRELAALCEVVAELRRLLLPAPPLLRRRRAGGVRGDDRALAATPAAPLHLTHATMNFGVNRGPGAGAPRAARRRRWPTAATSAWTPIRTCPAAPPCRRCCRAGRCAGGPDAILARLHDPAAARGSASTSR